MNTHALGGFGRKNAALCFTLRRVLTRSRKLLLLSGCLLAILLPGSKADADLLVLQQALPTALRYDENSRSLVGSFQPPFPAETLVGLAVGPDDNIYAGEDTLGFGGVVRFNGQTGEFISEVISNQPGTGLRGPSALTFGPDRRLYVAGGMSNNPAASVFRYDSQTGALLGAFVPPGSGGLNTISDLAFGRDGNLYVLDPGQGVLRYSGADGHFMSLFASTTNFSIPQNMAFNSGGDLFVSTATNGILHFSGTTGALLGTLIGPGILGFPKGLVFNPENRLHVCSTASNAVLRFDGTTGAFLDAFPFPTNGPPFSAGPTFVAIYRPLTNAWINPASDRWENAADWSLGILPDSVQAVYITNAGFKAVGIFPGTAQNFSNSMTVASLSIAAPPGSQNTLLLNYVYPTVPLQVLDGLTIGTNGALLNLFSGLIVSGGDFLVQGGQASQQGGITVVINGSLSVDGSYFFTNGTLTVSNVNLGVSGIGAFTQSGGLVTAQSMNLGGSVSGTGTYDLQTGNLNASAIVVGGRNHSTFTQDGGTNEMSQLTVEVQLNGGPSDYFLNGGTLNAGNESIFGGDFNLGTFTQTGGTHVISNELFMAGEVFPTGSIFPGRYILNGGNALFHTVAVSEYASLAVTNGSMSVQQTLEFSANGAIFRTSSSLAGGVLSCANFESFGVGTDFSQSGGALVVSNLFSYGGFAFEPPLGFATYNFSGGTLSASNIQISADFMIGSSAQSNRISNPGYFELSGALTTGNVNEHLGRFILGGNASVDFGGAAGRLVFANSSREAWTGGTQLQILHWNGLTNGGGSDQLIFGTNRNSLTFDQLAQIQFVNPAGFPPGTNFARILAAGEVVPTPQPPLEFMTVNHALVLTWPAGFVLQSATNALGPYLDVPMASSPYTNAIAGSQKYFRLRNGG